MKRIAKLLLAVAVGAGIPAVAIAQQAPDERGQDRGWQARDRDAREYGAPPRQERAPQDINRDRGPRPDIEAQRDDRRDGGNRFGDGRRPDDRRFDTDRRPDDRGFGADRRAGFDNRFADNRGFGNGRPGDNRWVGSNWRQDRRYDWRGYRDQNRGRVQFGRYNAPRGWGYGYRPFSIGAVVPNLLWGSDYWLADASAYRLPPAYGPYRWVRYYGDVLLIDVRNGRVVDAIPGFSR